MKIVSIIVLVVIALFILLPIISGRAPIPENLSPSEIGEFIGGYVRYWIAALREIF